MQQSTEPQPRRSQRSARPATANASRRPRSSKPRHVTATVLWLLTVSLALYGGGMKSLVCRTPSTGNAAAEPRHLPSGLPTPRLVDAT